MKPRGCPYTLVTFLLTAGSLLTACAPGNVPTPKPIIEPTFRAEAIPAQILRKDNSILDLTLNDPKSIQVNDRIIVPESGHGKLKIGDRLEVDILRGSELELTELKSEPGDSLFVHLKQNSGHTRIRLGDNANMRVMLETTLASSITSRAGTEFITCHAPKKTTCVMVVEGELEFINTKSVRILTAGMADYTLDDGTIAPKVCANMNEVATWLEAKLGTAEVPALGELFQKWNQTNCVVAATNPMPAPTLSAMEAPSATAALPLSDNMVQIQAGEYVIGSVESNEELRQTKVVSKRFWIDAYEVTNRDYQRFVAQQGYPTPVAGFHEDNHPVKGIRWKDARAFCAWANKRLPTNIEWEVAARGPSQDPPKYPWGNDVNAGGAFDQMPHSATYSVGSMMFNKSPFGVYDMAGNVWEWVDDPDAQGNTVLRGGRYGLIKDMAYRQSVSETTLERFVEYAGFRCAADKVQDK